MKRILTVVALTAMATSVFAQGTIVFRNQASNVVQQWTDASNSTLINVPKSGGFVQLFWAPTGTAYTPWTASMTPAAWYAANPGWTLDTHVTGFTTPAAGQFNGGTLTLATPAPGGTIDGVVVGWTGTATSFDAAIAAGSLVGVSGKFSSPTGNPNSVPAGTPVSIQSAIPAGMTLAPVPEPSTFALAGLGAAAMLIFRRRK